MNILVIAAHPDDEILGCGGTMARLSAEGATVHIAILGEGLSSRVDAREAVVEAEYEVLRDCSRRAAAEVGVQSVSFHGLPDNRFDSVDMLDVVKIIESLIEEIKPEIVYTQHGGDLNVDHVVTFRATLTATRPQGGNPVRAVYAYPVASSSEWAFGQFAPRFAPNLFVDISATLDQKIAGMAHYESESREFPHPRSPQSLRAQAQTWGSAAGLEAAEAFHIIREIR